MVERARIGVISDTHGLLRQRAIAALDGVDRILHAGDIGEPSILDRLGQIAPVTAVLGNCDRWPLTSRLSDTEVLETEHGLVYALHDLTRLDLDPATAGFRVVVSGHTHRPGQHESGEVLYLNPGSAGPVRNELPPTLALLGLGADGQASAEIVQL